MDTWHEGWSDDSERARYALLIEQVEGIKRELRERARIVAAREQELTDMRAELARQLDGTGAGKRKAGDTSERERELAAAIAAAERREQEAAAELALAQAERERLDEREKRIHEVERELAQRRIALEQERAGVSGAAPPEPAEPPESDPPPPTPLPLPPDEPELEPAAAGAVVLDDTVEIPPPAARSRRR
ncbi:MAG: hypothetical protein JOZ56_09655 [Actinobacteria bacterium]|nr:hypothetical protein [Actinomycetota bacterium]